MFRVQADRADAHRDERAKVCVVLAWLDRVDQRKKSRMDIVTADRFRRRRLTFDAMEAWVRYVVYRRRRVAGYANAVTWREARINRRVWTLWRAWLHRRGLKRAREAAALAMHRDDLLRNGARAWLTSGSGDARQAHRRTRPRRRRGSGGRVGPRREVRAAVEAQGARREGERREVRASR